MNLTGNDRGSRADDETHPEISRKLKALYDSVQEEEIPGRFLDLLEKLDAAEQSAKADGKGSRGRE